MEWKKLLSTKRAAAYTQAFTGSAFEEDYIKIIESASFRRLQDKTQAFPLEADDYVRTRLTHSMEVSAIGRILGEAVFRELVKNHMDPWLEKHGAKDFADILACAGLIHDIGNPPFGHFGEYAIREWFQQNLSRYTLIDQPVISILSEEMLRDVYQFEGNAQSLRVLSKHSVQRNEGGLNLTYAVLAAIIKYPIPSTRINIEDEEGMRYKKMGYYQSEKELFDAISKETGTNGKRHPLSFLLETADDIAYKTADVEDALVKDVLTLPGFISELEEYGDNTPCDEETQRTYRQYIISLKQHITELGKKQQHLDELNALQRWNKEIQKIMIHQAAQSFSRNYDQIMAGNYSGSLLDNTTAGRLADAIGYISEKIIYTNKSKIRTELYGRKIIASLLEQFVPAAIQYDTEREENFIDMKIMSLFSRLYKDSYKKESMGKDEKTKLYLRLMMTTDFISGMTDSYAKELFEDIL